MTNAAAILFRIYELPWSTGEEQEQKFKRMLAATVAAVLVLALILSLLPAPERDATEAREIPQRLARLMLEREPPPPPPVVREEPVPEPEIVEPEPEPEPVVEERIEPEPIPEPVPEPEPVIDTVQQARERASVAGLLPFAQELAALRDNENLERLDQTNLAGAAEGTAPASERSLITSSVGAGSGGINTASLSRNTGGSGLAGRATTQVDNPVDGFGPAGGSATRSGESNRGSRSREEIERVFDRNKGAIYALYNRALRENPALEGKLVLRLTISSDGTVTFCEVVSSELGDPDLEQKLVQRVLLFQFEAKDVESITTTKPIDFFPA
jgi:TonB family protein